MSEIITATSSGIAYAGVRYRYPDAPKPALDGIDWEIPEGAFTLVAGRSGSGKSTLLRCLNGLVPHFSGGVFGGQVTVHGLNTRHYGTRALSRTVGFVFQDPEGQFITSRVDDEIAFGMEQLGVPEPVMRKRVEEVLDIVGIARLRHREIRSLSGGERQRVAVAAALVLQAQTLVLDEPTSQLDPWGAEDVLTALVRLNHDLGLTVVLAEHRLERIVADVDLMRWQDASGLALTGEPRTVLSQADPRLAPPVVRIGLAREWRPLPLSIKEGRAAVRNDAWRPAPPPADPAEPGGAPIIQLQGVTLAYNGKPVVSGIDLQVRPGELVALMGRNGSGKTTVLRALLGFHRPERGRIAVSGFDASRTAPAVLGRVVGFLPQRASTLLFHETVMEELAFSQRNRPAGDPALDAWVIEQLGLASVLPRHPRDLSVGEQERVALAAVLTGSPPVLLLDEPTRGMDYEQKSRLGDILRHLRMQGVAIVMATHDVELAAELATRVVLLGDGQIVADGGPRATLSGSLSFATQVNKLYGQGLLTVTDVLADAQKEAPRGVDR